MQREDSKCHERVPGHGGDPAGYQVPDAASERSVPEDGDEEDPRRELVEQLLQYKMYKYMAYELKDRQTDADSVLYKQPTIPEEVRGVCGAGGFGSSFGGPYAGAPQCVMFQDVMKRQADKIDPVRSKFGKIEKEEVSLFG